MRLLSASFAGQTRFIDRGKRHFADLPPEHKETSMKARSKSSTLQRLIHYDVFAGALLCILSSAAAAQRIAVDPTNPQYFRFNNKTIALVGFSAEYICQIANPGAA
jgi:hypothetical protein